MQPDKIHSEADGYYGDGNVAEDELDLSFLDEEDKKGNK